MPALLSTLAEQVHVRRNARVLTQAELARGIGVTTKTITHLERGKGASLGLIGKLARFFECSETELVAPAEAEPAQLFPGLPGDVHEALGLIREERDIHALRAILRGLIQIQKDPGPGNRPLIMYAFGHKLDKRKG